MSTKTRGFASLSPERRKEVAAKGGRSAQERGVAHRWTPDEARALGTSGGQARQAQIAAREAVAKAVEDASAD